MILLVKQEAKLSKSKKNKEQEAQWQKGVRIEQRPKHWMQHHLIGDDGN